MKDSGMAGWTLSLIFTTTEAAHDRSLFTGQIFLVRGALFNVWTWLNFILRMMGKNREKGSKLYCRPPQWCRPCLLCRLICKQKHPAKRSFQEAKSLNQWHCFEFSGLKEPERQGLQFSVTTLSRCSAICCCLFQNRLEESVLKARNLSTLWSNRWVIVIEPCDTSADLRCGHFVARGAANIQLIAPLRSEKSNIWCPAEGVNGGGCNPLCICVLYMSVYMWVQSMYAIYVVTDRF